MGYTLEYAKDVKNDLKKIKAAKLDDKVISLFSIISQNPFQYPPEFEYSLGNLKGKISRRINKKHRLVYSVDENKLIVYILSVWTHYEGNLERK